MNSISLNGIAISEGKLNGEGGEVQVAACTPYSDETFTLTVKGWGETGSAISTTPKGTRLQVVGRLQTRKVQRQEGFTEKGVEIIATRIEK